MWRTVLIFGSLSAAIFSIFQLNKWSLWGLKESSDVFIVLSGLLFILIGFLINRFLYDRPTSPKSRTLKASNLSKQEHKILQLVAEGMSNHEIAQHLFIAESTVKSHLSNIFSKLKVKRRTQAIRIGRDLHII